MAPVPTDATVAEDYEASLDPEARAALGKVRKCMEYAKSLHEALEKKWNEEYGLYRNYRRLQDTIRDTPDRDRGGVILQARREWGAELFIPLVFSTIETIVPRVLAQNPTMTVRPRTPDAKEKTQAIKELLEQQQLDMDYDLKLQSVARCGFKYGLGVSKTYWKHSARKVTRSSKGVLGRRKAEEREIVSYDGPMVEPVSPWDFYWDPAASSIETARWVLHRTWRDLGYVKRKIASEEWMPVPLDKLQGQGDEFARANAFDERLTAQGMSGVDLRAGRFHEVWEYHDREHVITVLNKTYIVQNDITPFWHRELPFQIFRPTLQEFEFCGISEIEPIKHLQYELNTLRSQRRDNATAILDRIWFYSEGMLDEQLFKRGPGALIPVVGDPTEIVHSPPVQDIPASSYREEEHLLGDVDRATGISDPVSGADVGASDTATGIQLVQAAANVRISHKTDNLRREAIRPAARQIHELNRQHFSDKRNVRIDRGTDYEFAEIGPNEIDADVDIIPDVGSTEPENPVQKRNDALTLYNQLNGNPAIDPTKPLLHLLREHDIEGAEEWIAPQEDKTGMFVDASVEQLREWGIPDEQIEAFLARVLEQSGIQPDEQETSNQPAPEGEQ